MDLFSIPLHWVWLAIIMTAFCAVTPVFNRAALKRMDVSAAMAIEMAAAAVVFYFILRLEGKGGFYKGLSVRDWIFLAAVVLLLSIGSFLCMSSLKRADLNKAEPEWMIQLVFMTVLFMIVQKKMPGGRDLIILLMILIGIVLMMLRKGYGEGGWAVLGLIGSVLLLIGRFLESRFLPASLRGPVLYFAVALVLAVFGWIVILFAHQGKDLKKITIWSALLQLLAGLALSFAVVAGRRAMGGGDRSVVTSMLALALPISVLFAGAFLKEKQTGLSLLGLILLTGGALLLHL